MNGVIMRYITGQNRDQTSLLPESLEDFVPGDHPVRVMDAFVDQLDLKALGFNKVETKHTGRKPYHPGDLLKLYLYGYFNQIRSSRQLEKECNRNLELLWLVKRLSPDFKTIADFRRDNGEGIRAVCRSFVQFCKKINLIGGALIAIDGSKFKAAASKDQIMTAQKAEHSQRIIDKNIEYYLAKLEAADREDSNTPLMNKEHVEKALNELEKRKSDIQKIADELKNKGLNQYCQTEPEAKIMRSGREGMILAYNVQTAVDAKARLIIHHEVVTEGSDCMQLAPISKATATVINSQNFTVLADAGYSSGEQLAECDEQGIEAILPLNRALNNNKDIFPREAFNYDAELDQYTCPQGEILQYQTRSKKDKLWLYTTKACGECPLKSQCTSGKQRWISRHFNEDAFLRCKERLLKNPGIMRQRSAIVEAPFGSMKQMMRNGRFLCKGLKMVKTEMALSVLAYNLKRVVKIIGVKGLIAELA